MISLALAVVLLLDPAPKQNVAAKPKPAAVETALATGRTLASVAVTVECTATASGRVEDCEVLGETHPGIGFGEAAVALMNGGEVVPGPEAIRFARTIQFLP